MTYTNIGALPDAPSRQQPSTFAAKTDVFLAALQPWADQVNAAGAYVEVTAASVANDKTASAASAVTASNAATTATTAATTATTAATNSENSATASATSATNAAVTLVNFEKLYLGQKSANPTVDNAGNPLIVGALYYNTVDLELRIWDSGQWNKAVFNVDTTGALLNVNNLSDLASASAALVNLGITLTANEINSLPEVVQNIEKGSLTKSFSLGETAILPLSASAGNSPLVAVTKEVGQTGVTTDQWALNASGSNFEFEDFAYAVDLAVDTTAKTLTLTSGSWDAGDVGKRVTGNGGDVTITAVDAAVATYKVTNVDFTDETTIVSGSWSLLGLTFSGGELKVNSTPIEGVPELDLGRVNNYRNSGLFGSYARTSEVLFNPTGTVAFYFDTSDNVRSTVLPKQWSSFGNLGSTSTSSVGAQESTPYGMAWNSDGTKLFVAGNAGLHEYNTASPYTLPLTHVRSVTSFGSGLYSVHFNPTGSRMWVLKVSNSTMVQYELSTPWDITTKDAGVDVFTGRGLNGGFFTFEGTFFVFSNASGTILSKVEAMTPWDFTGNLGVTRSQKLAAVGGTFIQGMAQKGGGTGFWLLSNSTSSQIREFSTTQTHVWDPVNDVLQLPTVGGSGNWSRASISADGVHMYVYNGTSKFIYQFEMSVPWDKDTLFYTGKSFTHTTYFTTLYAFDVSADGKYLYVASNNSSYLYRWEMTTPWDLDSITLGNFQTNSGTTAVISIDFRISVDGTKLFMAQGDSVRTYVLNTPWSITSITEAPIFTLPFGTSTSYVSSISEDGLEFLITCITTSRVHSLRLDVPYDLTSWVETKDILGSLNMWSAYRTPQGTLFGFNGSDDLLEVRPSSYPVDQVNTLLPNIFGTAITQDGSKIFLLDSDRVLKQFNLSTAGDIANLTATPDKSKDLSTAVATAGGLYLKADGTKIWVGDSGKIHEYLLAVPFDASSAVSVGNILSVSPMGSSTVRGFMFNNTGDKLFVLDTTPTDEDHIIEYVLSVPWDITSASYTSNQINVMKGGWGMCWLENGTKIVVGANAPHVYSLTEAWNPLSGITLVDRLWRSNLNYGLYSLSSFGNHVYTGMDYIAPSSLVRFSLSTLGESAPKGQYLVAKTTVSGQILTNFWLDINGMTATEYSSTNAKVYYAVSTDDSVTYKIVDDTLGERTIARDNGGTWEFNSNVDYASETWTTSTKNTPYGAISEAMTIEQNQMDKTQLDAVQDANHFTLEDTLDLAVILNYQDGIVAPRFTEVEINYDAQSLWKGAIIGTDYDYDYPANDVVRITSLGDYNLKVKVL